MHTYMCQRTQAPGIEYREYEREESNRGTRGAARDIKLTLLYTVRPRSLQFTALRGVFSQTHGVRTSFEFSVLGAPRNLLARGKPWVIGGGKEVRATWCQSFRREGRNHVIMYPMLLRHSPMTTVSSILSIIFKGQLIYLCVATCHILNYSTRL
jgi:hypothetical protein